MPTNRATETSLYKGCPILTIYTGHKHKGEDEYLRIGPRKAKAILEQLDPIRCFVEQAGGETITADK